MAAEAWWGVQTAIGIGALHHYAMTDKCCPPKAVFLCSKGGLHPSGPLGTQCMLPWLGVCLEQHADACGTGASLLALGRAPA
jgi:hypothetical protein